MHNPGRRTAKRWIRTEIIPLLVLLVLLTAARSSLADHYHVPTGSMEYSLLPGDRVFVDKTAYGLRIPYTKIDIVPRANPARGDIAVFDSPQDGTLLIKRIVAVEGDHVELWNGRLRVNGIAFHSPDAPDVERFGEHRARLNLANGGGPDIADLVIPKDMVLVLGDHRGNSIDGRFFGLIPRRELYGKAVAVYYRSDQGFVWKRL